ncbi:four-helix bundle copper-binding protein [Effusibacillus consociatus]|uniref:Four-helix bundle copper-binding protein n=1 Tax=Effusibacillus consociatus TaxID=1117041 RepID=A0ABV9PZ67_9BACL
MPTPDPKELLHEILQGVQETQKAVKEIEVKVASSVVRSAPPMMMVTSTQKTLHDCMTMCEQMILTAQRMPDVHARFAQLVLLRDCADICELCAKFMARHSPFTKSLCQLCAHMCETCAKECLKFPDRESQMCAQMLLKCAEECRVFAAR